MISINMYSSDGQDREGIIVQMEKVELEKKKWKKRMEKKGFAFASFLLNFAAFFCIMEIEENQ